MNKVLAFIITILIFGNVLFAQSSSPYSRFGIGDIVFSNSARNLGMGATGIAVADDEFAGTQNPATWFKLDRTRINFDFNYSALILSNNNQNNFYGEAQFNGITFSFPISTLYGISFFTGLTPYSNVSYKTVDEVAGSGAIGSYTQTLEGSGGISKVYAGTSYRLPFNLTIGATFDYYFGNITYSSEIDFSDTRNSDAVYENRTHPSGFGTTVGLVSPDLSPVIKSNSITEFRIGGFIEYLSELDADTILTLESGLSTDTISEGITKMKIPPKFGGGMSVTFNNEYLLALDYVFQPWQEFSIRGNKSSNLRNMSKISAGFEYNPVQELGTTFWEQIIWRAGLSFKSSQYQINGDGINQYSVMGGFSIPLGPESTIDIGLMYAFRGTQELNLFKENKFLLDVGINFGSIWFTRQNK